MGYDFIVAGAGPFGATAARVLTDAGKKCLVIDRCDHIAGNCYDYLYNNYYVSVYGGHFFHANSDYVWEFLNRFAKFNNFRLISKEFHEGQLYSYPINLTTLHKLWGITTPEQARKKLDEVKLDIPNPKNFEEKILGMIGKELYEKFIFGYTSKMWQTDPKEMPVGLTGRIPVRFNYEEHMFNDKYQGQPAEGYTRLFENMLDGIEVRLNTPYEKDMKAENVIYTGSIDDYYDCRYGPLGYRASSRIWDESELGNTMFTYSDLDIPYIRKFSYSYAYPEKNNNGKFVTSTEFSIDGIEVKDYPINNSKNEELYNKYKAINTPNIFFGGRLGQYKYFDMDQCIASALTLCKKLI